MVALQKKWISTELNIYFAVAYYRVSLMFLNLRSLFISQEIVKPTIPRLLKLYWFNVSNQKCFHFRLSYALGCINNKSGSFIELAYGKMLVVKNLNENKEIYF